MISFDQVLLLEEKVESAVKKIEQLNAENAALRNKCAELSNALKAKSEQFSSFESDQSKIEEGILKALSRLNAVENVVLSATAAQSPSNPVPVAPVQSTTPSVSEPEPAPAVEENFSAQEEPLENHFSEEASIVEESSVSGGNEAVSQSEEPSASDSLTPDVDFEFGESDAGSAENPQNPESESSAEADSNQEQTQPLFDIF